MGDLLLMGAQVIQLVAQLIDPDPVNWILALLFLGNLLLTAEHKRRSPRD
ncbi:hypothetical protein [Kitasatospora purpeofusca]|nr:hypothetical protein OIP63_00885 [Kitasatospora purpeofusca]